MKNWLLIRGLFREQRHWGRFPKVLESTIPGSRVFCLDLPGVGTEIARKSPISISEIVLDLRSRWLKLKESQPGDWNCLAISLGGMVAMEWTSKFSDDFKKVTLINTSASNIGWPWQRMKPGALKGLLTAVMRRDIVTREIGILKTTTHGFAPIKETAAIWAGFAKESPPNITVAFSQLAAAIKYKAPTRIPIPVQILASGNDALTDPTCSRTLANRFGAVFSEHPDAGHDLPLEAPEWIAEQVAGFVG